MGKEREQLKGAMARWDKMDQMYRARIGRQVEAINRLLRGLTVAEQALTKIADDKQGCQSCRAIAETALVEVRSHMNAVQTQMEEESKG